MTGHAVHQRDLVVGGVVTAVLVGLMAARFADTPTAILAYGWLTAMLVVQSVVDLRTRRLPREITNLGLVVGAPLLAVAALAIDEPGRIWMMLLGAVIATVALWLVQVLSGGDFGEGDVRLAPLLGLYLGWLNPALVFVALLLAFVAGAAVGAALLATRRLQREASLPFGPFLALATVTAVLVGQPFLDLVITR